MEKAILRISPENFITVGLFSAVAYLGVVGAKMLLSKVGVK
jgi:hypothetical protein